MKNEKFDIATAMLQNLQAEAVENTTNAEKLSLAISCISKAANILDGMKDFSSSEKLTKVIEKLASLK